ncbi:MAG: PKD domain-containing protein [bacterium]|nr:PKD domain-containing protein [bacterium]
MRKKITLIALSVFGMTLPILGQQAAEIHKEHSASDQPIKKPIQHAQTKAFTKIWGAEAVVGVAEGQFQNGFIQSTTPSSYSPTSWTALTVSESSGSVTPGNAYWTQTMTGTSQGAYWGSEPAMQSPTVGNGAAIFDSDFMDNGGTAGAFGTGSSPAAHEGWLVSPRIDLTGYTDSVIAVRFWSKWREFSVNDFTISVSTDDGATWLEESIAADLPSGNNHVEGWVSNFFTNAFLGVPNLTQCRIRFRFNGDYYYAMVDDVTIESGPSVDLTIAANNISSGVIADQMNQVQIMNNRHMPISGITNPRDFTFGAVVQNEGGGVAQNISFLENDLIAHIQRDNGGVWTTVHSDTIEIPTFDYVSSVQLTDTLSDVSWATVGEYRVLYVVDHWNDANTMNDTLEEFFTINDDTYASKVQRDQNGLPLIETQVFPGGTQSTFEFGSTFEFSNMGTNNLKLDSISQGFYIPGNYAGASDINYTIRYYEWNDVNASLTIDDMSELTLVALGYDTLTNVTASVGGNIMQSTQLTDVTTMAAGYEMQDNKIYVATVSMVAAENGLTSFGSTAMPWIACASSVNYGMNFFYTNEKPSFLHLIDGGGTEILVDQGFGMLRIPAMGLHISPACSPVTADLNFSANFLAVDFTDASTSQGDPATSWSWTFGDGNTSTMQNPNHTYTAPGQYEVCLTVTNSCSSDTFCDSVVVQQNTSSLTENWVDALLIYPNPSEDVVRIQNLPEGGVTIELRNVVGQLVYETSIDSEVGVEIPVSHLAAGHYNLILRSEMGVANKHIVVK